MESPILALADHLDELKTIRDNYEKMTVGNHSCVALLHRKVDRLNGQIESTEKAIMILINVQKEEE